MKATHIYVVQHRGGVVECYGNLEATSNFEVVCEDEMDDDVWPYGIEGALTWENVVQHLQAHFDSTIVEISAC
jgi:hypothetical protein